ncbi:hypothetical protein C4D60_Mb01t07110 [Musa balbisiana]|uniref:Uncharacterized protein n=1 Tax=Musa balbisiana TaxID=52838 RepID=A0A4S8JLT1_MUSBA|nr:hypothetical protein C4D60_Mb01t07110 [Musa balbisiana]
MDGSHQSREMIARLSIGPNKAHERVLFILPPKPFDGPKTQTVVFSLLLLLLSSSSSTSSDACRRNLTHRTIYLLCGRVELKRHLNQSTTCEHSSSTHFAFSEKHPPAMGVPFGGIPHNTYFL